jgi:hypothetical protein
VIHLPHWMLPHDNPLPWVTPGTLVFAIVGVFASGPIARALRTRRIVAWLLVVSLAMIVFATLVPLYGAFESAAGGRVGCDLSIWTPVSLDDFLAKNDRALNVLLFMPLGFALGLLPRSRRSALLLLGAITLPVVIEASQSLLTVLNRACESGDVIDNLTGLAVGWAAGLVVGLVIGRLAAWADAAPVEG